MEISGVTDRLRAAFDLPPFDQELISLLQADGRRSYAAMGRDLKVGEKAVRRRVLELLESGVIAITTVADPALLGYGALALVGIKVDQTRTTSEVAEEVALLDEADHVVVASGRFDVIAEIACRDSDELLDTVQRRVARIPGIAHTETFPYLRLHYQQPAWGSAQGKSGTREQEGAPVASLDVIDRTIISQLSEDGRMPFPRIASAVGISESQVRQRVNTMVGHGLVRIMALTNPQSLGYRTTAWLAISIGPGAAAGAIAERLAAIPSITYVAVCAGRFDIFAEAVCVNSEDLLRLLDEDVRPLSGVAHVETSMFIRIYYRRLRPHP
jgi:DNA-binding Lrp family transcriptional regulator